MTITPPFINHCVSWKVPTPCRGVQLTTILYVLQQLKIDTDSKALIAEGCKSHSDGDYITNRGRKEVNSFLDKGCSD